MKRGFFARRHKFNQIARDIKKIKIQGARNIARKAIYAYHLIPTKKSKNKLMKLRPTEPMLMNVLDRIDRQSYSEILMHFNSSQEKINLAVFKLIKNNDVIFTHCHSTNVVNSLVYAKKKKKKFEIYNTETRPLFQGRKTAKELLRHKIKVTMFVDSAGQIALTKAQGTKKVDKVFLGADALLDKGIINKVGSGMFAQIANDNKIPVYIIADSWKYSPKNLKLEERDFHEVWEKVSKKSKIKIENPAFEFVPKKLIKGIVTEFGLMSYDKFLKNIRN